MKLINLSSKMPLTVCLQKKMGLVLLFVALGLQVIACSCRPPSALTTEEFFNADLVFEGKAVSVEMDEESHIKVITFEITTPYKTAKGMTKVEVTTAGSSAACGINVTEGQMWYIWARKNKETDSYSTGICSRSLQLAEDGSKKYFQRYNDEVALIKAFNARRGKQRLDLSTGSAEGKMRKGLQCGKWRYFDAEGNLLRTCKYRKGIQKSCVDAEA